MKGKQIFYWLSLLLCLAVAGCSSDGEDEGNRPAGKYGASM